MPTEDSARPGASDDPDDYSREAINDALVRCIRGDEKACSLFYIRMILRCNEKVQTWLQKEFGVPTSKAEPLVTEKIEDMTFLAQKGKLKIERGYTEYLKGACRNALRDEARLKKGHEIPLGDLRHKLRNRSNESTVNFIGAIIAPGRNPESIAIERELERKIGEQVGGLPSRMREVISLTREGFDYAEIAKEVERAYSTIKAEFWQAIEQLRIAVQGSGILFPPKPLPAFTYPNSSIPSRRALRKLIADLPIEYRMPLEWIHFEGKVFSSVQKQFMECRAGVESLLLHGYWLIRRATGVKFPQEYVHRLGGHPEYDLHRIPFKYW